MYYYYMSGSRIYDKKDYENHLDYFMSIICIQCDSIVPFRNSIKVRGNVKLVSKVSNRICLSCDRANKLKKIGI
jgi:hypothetical protein